MTTVTLNGNTYNDTSTPPGNMGNGGHRANLLPMLADAVVDLAAKQSSASSSAATATTQAGNASASSASASGSAATATTQAANASSSASSASSSATLANQWATQLGTPVAGGEYSAKYWAGVAGTLATGQLIYMGAWNASGGSYPAAPVKGAFWKVSVAGTVSAVLYSIGDDIIYNGAAWDKIDNQVASIIWATKTAAYTAVSGDALMCNTTAAPFAVTLPAAPAANDVVRIADYAGTFGANNLTVARNGLKIMGLAEDMTISTNNASIKLTYIDATQGWKL